MPEVAIAWDGNEWEAHCLNLLRVRYRPPATAHFQKVPPEDRGDHGIEGYSTDGHVYQCYAPDPRHKIKDRHTEQRRKLTEDIGKLIDNADGIADLIGDMKIKKYYFMVPDHDSKELNKHAQAQAKRVRDRNLPIVDDEFDIVIVTEADFPIERQQLLSEGLDLLRITDEQPSTEQMDAYLAGDPDLLRKLDEKLAKIPDLSPGMRTRLREVLVGRMIRGDIAVSDLRRQYPSGYDQLERIRGAKEDVLEVECLLSALEPTDLIRSVQEGYKAQLDEELTFLRGSDLQVIAWGTTAAWLVDCPLDFEVTP